MFLVFHLAQSSTLFFFVEVVKTAKKTCRKRNQKPMDASSPSLVKLNQLIALGTRYRSSNRDVWRQECDDELNVIFRMLPAGKQKRLNECVFKKEIDSLQKMLDDFDCGACLPCTRDSLNETSASPPEHWKREPYVIYKSVESFSRQSLESRMGAKKQTNTWADEIKNEMDQPTTTSFLLFEVDGKIFIRDAMKKYGMVVWCDENFNKLEEHLFDGLESTKNVWGDNERLFLLRNADEAYTEFETMYWSDSEDLQKLLSLMHAKISAEPIEDTKYHRAHEIVHEVGEKEEKKQVKIPFTVYKSGRVSVSCAGENWILVRDSEIFSTLKKYIRDDHNLETRSYKKWCRHEKIKVVCNDDNGNASLKFLQKKTRDRMLPILAHCEEHVTGKSSSTKDTEDEAKHAATDEATDEAKDENMDTFQFQRDMSIVTKLTTNASTKVGIFVVEKPVAGK